MGETKERLRKLKRAKCYSLSRFMGVSAIQTVIPLAVGRSSIHEIVVNLGCLSSGTTVRRFSVHHSPGYKYAGSNGNHHHHHHIADQRWK